jgi:hypothetical protein
MKLTSISAFSGKFSRSYTIVAPCEGRGFNFGRASFRFPQCVFFSDGSSRFSGYPICSPWKEVALFWKGLSVLGTSSETGKRGSMLASFQYALASLARLAPQRKFPSRPTIPARVLNSEAS